LNHAQLGEPFVSILTLPLTATPEPPEPTVAQLRERLTLLTQEHGDLLAAAQATLAAEGLNMSAALGFLRDHLKVIGALPPDGAHPRHYQPVGPDGAVWGRW
jgi:hypothetical protein